MVESTEFALAFGQPPIVETRLGVQFTPLLNFKAVHYGIFLKEFLVDIEGWRILPDQPSSPPEMERFGIKVLNPTVEQPESHLPGTCVRVASRDGSRKILFQPNKLTIGWNREKEACIPFAEVKTHFDDVFEKFEAFAAEWKLGTPVVNLWEIAYVNKIPAGELWSTPSDWHRVLPGLFTPNGPQILGHEWGTFNGTWYFEIPPERGRVRVQVQKAVANQTDELVMLLVITARGEIGGSGVQDWSTGLNLGHQSALRAFYDLASPEAKQKWGIRS